jgi:hypothetical protein
MYYRVENQPRSARNAEMFLLHRIIPFFSLFCFLFYAFAFLTKEADFVWRLPAENTNVAWTIFAALVQSVPIKFTQAVKVWSAYLVPVNYLSCCHMKATNARPSDHCIDSHLESKSLFLCRNIELEESFVDTVFSIEIFGQLDNQLWTKNNVQKTRVWSRWWAGLTCKLLDLVSLD